jgi:hypothetical protein
MLSRVYGLVMALAVIGGVCSQVYVNFPEPNVYLLVTGVLTAWLISDAMDRGLNWLSIMSWSLFSFFLAPIVVPRWYASRPLKNGEMRKGGNDANFFNAFGLITVVFTGVSAALNFMDFGSNRGFEIIINAGFAVAGTAFVLALSTRRDSITETGRPLATETVTDNDKLRK